MGLDGTVLLRGPSIGRSDYVALAPNGDVLGTFMLPGQRAHVQEVSRSHAWVIDYDEDGFGDLVRYRLGAR